MFDKARLKLTTWYLLIIFLVSLLFSGAIYFGVDQEFSRIERYEKLRQEEEKNGMLPFIQLQQERDGQNVVFRLPRRFDPSMITQSRMRIITTLGLVNLGILLLSGFAGYFLAGRTLRPIKKMMDEQNRFVTDASHELRTPITALKSEIEVYLRDKKLTLEQAKGLLESNLQEVNSLQVLSDSLLRLAQYEVWTDGRTREKIAIDTIVSHAVQRVANLAKQKKIVIKKTVAKDVVEGEKQSLCELFVTILDNAIKYSNEKSTVTITSETTEKFVVIAIQDEGIGIEQEDMVHLFDRFYRADKSRTKKESNGYGLGLSIAKNIVEAHNGSIRVKSTIGQGTTFSISLPKV